MSHRWPPSQCWPGIHTKKSLYTYGCPRGPEGGAAHRELSSRRRPAQLPGFRSSYIIWRAFFFFPVTCGKKHIPNSGPHVCSENDHNHSPITSSDNTEVRKKARLLPVHLFFFLLKLFPLLLVLPWIQNLFYSAPP